MAKQTNNTTYAGYRVFETLAFLTRQPANVKEITKYLESLDDDTDKYISKAVIYKYLSTLKFAGIEFKRNKCKFEIAKLPFKMNFSDDDVIALKLLQSMLRITPEKQINEDIDKFFYQLNMRFTFDENFDESVIENIKEIPSITPEQLNEVHRLEKIQSEDVRLKITYQNILNKTVTRTCELVEVKAQKSNVMVKLYDTTQGHFLILNAKQIDDIEFTPLRTTHKYPSSTTIYKLKNKLAKRYTLREGERTINVSINGDATIANNVEPKETLMLRLMRYGEDCELLTPLNERYAMKELVNNALNTNIST